MSPPFSRLSVPLLRWTLGLAVTMESWQFATSASTANFFARARLPLWLRLGLGRAEIIATILFLISVAARAGGYSLRLIFGVAALIHRARGQFAVKGLVVYGAAVLVCMANQARETVEPREG